ncbi:hypothetical protein [Delftia sp. WSY_7]|uniref:hypothetical protein n=1 Tax=Delftia sp. WSY_7 TaxID=3367202 RepID=UPI00370B0EA0
MGNRERVSRRCYYCGELATSREHAPPQSFFPKNFKLNLITVPSCEKHNNSKSKNDEYVFHLISSSPGFRGDNEIDRYLVKKCSASLTNMKLGNRPRTIHHLLERMHEDVRMEAVKEDTSHRHFTLTYSARIDYDAVNDFFQSLGRALVFHEKQIVFSSNDIVMPHQFGQVAGSAAAKLSEGLKKTSVPLNKWLGENREIFIYNIDCVSDNIFVDMCFYSRFFVSVIFRKIVLIP